MSNINVALPAAPATVAPRSRPHWLSVAAAIAVVGTFVRALWFTPLEALQGAAQKILYIHATAAFVGLYLGCGLVAFASLAYLWLKDERADRLAESAAETAFVFLSVVLVTGPIWARPIWGTWWTWDARLTLTLFLWFVVVGYLVLRGAIEDHAMRALLGGARHPRGGARAVHPPQRVPVPHAAPDADRAQAERAVHVARDGDDVRDGVRVVHTPVRGVPSLALRARHGARGAGARRDRARRHGRRHGRALTMPENAGYMHAAYAVAATAYVLYALSLWRRRRALRDRAGRLRDTAAADRTRRDA